MFYEPNQLQYYRKGIYYNDIDNDTINEKY